MTAKVMGTLGGYILSLWFGLFGFHEIRTTAGVVAGVVEVAAFVSLGSYAAVFCRGDSSSHDTLARAGRRALAPLAGLGALALVLAVANSPGASSGPAPTGITASSTARGGTFATVTIKNFTFLPASLTVSPGERVVVTNRDSVTHTFTAVPGSTPYGNFNSGHIAPGKTVTVIAPKKPGSYDWYCEIHPFMTGTLKVT